MCRNNSNPWMNLYIFKEWLFELNEKPKQKILLTLDNTPVHPIYTMYSNVKLLYFQLNRTTLIQPCDQEIIKSFESLYKNVMTTKIVFELDLPTNGSIEYNEPLNKTTLYDALCFVQIAWEKVSTSTIVNYYNKTIENSMILKNKNCIGSIKKEIKECYVFDTLKMKRMNSF